MQKEKSKSQESFDTKVTCEIFKGSFQRKKKDEYSALTRVIINTYESLSFFFFF